MEASGDAALTVRFGDAIDPKIHDLVLGFLAALEDNRPPWITEIVPTAHAVTIFLSPGMPHTKPSQWLATLARTMARRQSHRLSGRLIRVPVIYGGKHGPDLDDVAAFAEITPREVVRLHTGTEYRVYFLGFAPGFPYLGRVPDVIAMPRLSTPRTRVPSGSIGLAGPQTGIYPQESPGGWRIIGHTALRLYDPNRRRPFLFAPGDRVRFHEVAR